MHSEQVDTHVKKHRENHSAEKLVGHLESSKAGGEKSEVLEVVLQRVSSDLSFFCICIYNSDCSFDSFIVLLFYPYCFDSC